MKMYQDKKLNSFISFIIFFLVSISPVYSTDVGDLYKPIKDTIDELVASDKVPGFQYIIMDKDKILFSYAAGWADIKKRVPMTLDTTMMVYSTTKVLTTAAILKLVDQGKLNLDDTLEKHLPYLPYKGDVTIRRILSHSSGIPEPDTRGWIHFREKHDKINRKELLKKVLRENPGLAYKPGERRQYSNLGFALLGEVIEKVSGLSYEDYMRKEIFAPLGVKPEEMDFFYQGSANQAIGYINKKAYFYERYKTGIIKNFPTKSCGDWEWITKFWHMNFPAHGGVIASARGYVKFLQDQLREKSCLFSNRTKKMFYTPQEFKDGSPIGSVLGWRIAQAGDLTVYAHGGGGLAYITQIALFPGKGAATVMMYNRTRLDDQEAWRKLQRLYLPE